jgi:hypothetical protein
MRYTGAMNHARHDKWQVDRLARGAFGGITPGLATGIPGSPREQAALPGAFRTHGEYRSTWGVRSTYTTSIVRCMADRRAFCPSHGMLA